MQTDSFQCVFAMARGRSCWVGARSVVVDKVKELLYTLRLRLFAGQISEIMEIVRLLSGYSRFFKLTFYLFENVEKFSLLRMRNPCGGVVKHGSVDDGREHLFQGR